MSSNCGSYRVFGGGEVQVYGDLHLSCVYSGQHIDYTAECYRNMDSIVRKVKEGRASAVVFLGDVIGVNERVINDRQFLMRVYLFFKTLNELTRGNVYTVRGNHDMGDFPDLDFFIGVGLLKNPRYVDYYRCSAGEWDGSDSGLEVRFHFVNYGDEERELDIVSSDSCSNVVFGHADFIVDSVNSWSPRRGGVYLSRLGNFAGVDLVISGHIHNPSEGLVNALVGGSEVGLFYVGSPARVSERYDDCWYIKFSYDGEYTNYDAELFGLERADVVFYPKEDFISEEGVDEEIARESESLSNIVREIMEGRITCGDIFSQVRAVPGASDEVKDIACSYLSRAIDKK